MSLSSALVASAIGALIGRPVITYNDYCRDLKRDLEALDMKAFLASQPIVPPVQPHQTPLSEALEPPPEWLVIAFRVSLSRQTYRITSY